MEYFAKGWKVSKLMTIEDIKINTIELFPIWKGQTAVIVAGGASLKPWQVELAKGFRTIVINDGYRLAPWADILYACDARWWGWHANTAAMKAFTGYKLQHYCKSRLNNMHVAPPAPDVDAILSDGNEGFSDDPRFIRNGGNSGYQALHVALHLGAKNIILIGYDMHAELEATHWFGEHPHPYNSTNHQRYVIWRQEFPALREAADKRGQRIINCTPGSRLDCFEAGDLREVLEGVRV